MEKRYLFLQDFSIRILYDIDPKPSTPNFQLLNRFLEIGASGLKRIVGGLERIEIRVSANVFAFPEENHRSN